MAEDNKAKELDLLEEDDEFEEFPQDSAFVSAFIPDKTKLRHPHCSQFF